MYNPWLLIELCIFDLKQPKSYCRILSNEYGKICNVQ